MTKTIFYIQLFILPLCGFSQTKPAAKADDKITISKTLTAMPGEFYVDSVKVDINKTILDPGNVKQVKVFKPDAAKDKKGAKGATLITRKSKPHLYVLTDLIKSMRNDFEQLKDAKTVKVIIDDREIKDLSGYLIEKSAIAKVDIKVDDATEKDKAVPEIVITTKQPKKKK